MPFILDRMASLCCSASLEKQVFSAFTLLTLLSWSTICLPPKTAFSGNAVQRFKPTKLLITQAAISLNTVYDSLHALRTEINRLASLLPEYELVMEMEGVGKITGPQLMAEVGDVRRFSHKGALVAYAGVDAPPYQSGTFDAKNRHVSKRGSPHLRKVLFEIASMILVHGNPDNSVFCFMDKKRAEGKHFYVYTVAGAAKFLRIYYARVKEYLNTQEIA